MTKHLDRLRDELLTAQTELIRDKSFALAVVVTGIPTAGRSEVVNQFLEWLDAKHIKVHALNELGHGPPSIPPMRRYWAALPARGEIAIFFLGWYEDYLASVLHERKRSKRVEARLAARIKQFETMLHFDRVRVLKLHLRVDRKTQKQRIGALEADKATRWRITPEERWIAKHYGRFAEATERMIQATQLSVAPWRIIDGSDPDERSIRASSLLLQELQAGLSKKRKALVKVPWAASIKRSTKPLPTRGPEVENDTYERELEALQGRLAKLTRKRAFSGHSVVLAFEGLDAAGKGGAIRRLTGALDARQYTVIPVSAPTPEELARPYLWRFWRNLPERGEFAIFDRSWYGRVLVERVRDLTDEADWRRAYDEINAFESQLVDAKMIVQKFWLSVGKDEQLKRLKDRREEHLKRFKVDEEDWKNRRYYDEYQVAAKEMIDRTNTEHAPWVIVEADDKKYARLKVLSAVCDAIELRVES